MPSFGRSTCDVEQWVEFEAACGPRRPLGALVCGGCRIPSAPNCSLRSMSTAANSRSTAGRPSRRSTSASSPLTTGIDRWMRNWPARGHRASWRRVSRSTGPGFGSALSGVLMFVLVRDAGDPVRLGPVAQWKSVRFTRGRSLVRTQPGPPRPGTTTSECHFKAAHSHRTTSVHARPLTREPRSRSQDHAGAAFHSSGSHPASHRRPADSAAGTAHHSVAASMISDATSRWATSFGMS